MDPAISTVCKVPDSLLHPHSGLSTSTAHVLPSNRAHQLHSLLCLHRGHSPWLECSSLSSRSLSIFQPHLEYYIPWESSLGIPKEFASFLQSMHTCFHFTPIIRCSIVCWSSFLCWELLEIQGYDWLVLECPAPSTVLPGLAQETDKPALCLVLQFPRQPLEGALHLNKLCLAFPALL